MLAKLIHLNFRVLLPIERTRICLCALYVWRNAHALIMNAVTSRDIVCSLYALTHGQCYDKWQSLPLRLNKLEKQPIHFRLNIVQRS